VAAHVVLTNSAGPRRRNATASAPSRRAEVTPRLDVALRARAGEDPKGRWPTRTALELDAGICRPPHRITLLADKLGRLADARTAADAYLERFPRQPTILAARAVMRARAGEIGPRHGRLPRLLEICPTRRHEYRVGSVLALLADRLPRSRPSAGVFSARRGPALRVGQRRQRPPDSNRSAPTAVPRTVRPPPRSCIPALQARLHTSIP
jgi:hypothetical protein